MSYRKWASWRRWRSGRRRSEGCSRVDEAGAGGEILENEMNGSGKGEDAKNGSLPAGQLALRWWSRSCDITLYGGSELPQACGCWYLPGICSSVCMNCEVEFNSSLGSFTFRRHHLFAWGKSFSGLSLSAMKTGDKNSAIMILAVTLASPPVEPRSRTAADWTSTRAVSSERNTSGPQHGVVDITASLVVSFLYMDDSVSARLRPVGTGRLGTASSDSRATAARRSRSTDFAATCRRDLDARTRQRGKVGCAQAERSGGGLQLRGHDR